MNLLFILVYTCLGQQIDAKNSVNGDAAYWFLGLCQALFEWHDVGEYFPGTLLRDS